MKHTLENIAILHSTRTLGSENAIIALDDRPDSLNITLQFPFPAQHLAHDLQTAIERAVHKPVALRITHNIIAHKVQAGLRTIKGVKNIIAIASGKGGVGKSTTAANLATAMAKMGAKVGVLDADLYGPSQPFMLGVSEQKPTQENGLFIPVRNADGIQVMSIGFLIEPEQAVIWRGPLISQALQQLLFQSQWDDLDYLFIDLPPGTGDIQLTISQKIPVTGAIIVTTPQDIALIDARKAIDMFQKVNIPILGILENMSLHICSQCGHHENIFGDGGGARLADTHHVPLLAQLPLSLPVRQAMDTGQAGQLQAQHPKIAECYTHAAWQIALTIADIQRDFSHRFPNIVVQ